jgi:hypothetical protein
VPPLRFPGRAPLRRAGAAMAAAWVQAEQGHCPWSPRAQHPSTWPRAAAGWPGWTLPEPLLFPLCELLQSRGHGGHVQMHMEQGRRCTYLQKCHRFVIFTAHSFYVLFKWFRLR